MTQPGQPSYGQNQPPTAANPPIGGQPAGGYPDPAGGRGIRQGPGWATYLFTLIAALIAIAVAVFIAQNTDTVTIKFFNTRKSFTEAGLLGICVGAGFLIGLLLGLIPSLKAKRELRQYRRGNR